ncbi:MAG: UTP--glucose-1-phosphate uridylyltransferase [Cyanobacteria bacterium J007]|nr:MAG: UTP--glucose-1-phosphate uridylyltransferase [Cyanobacteria bacterium J007]
MTEVKSKVRKAVIPAGGFGTRLFPATKAIAKELFPIVDRDGIAKPIILAIAEEAISGGIEQIAIVTRESDRAQFEDFFKTPLSEAFDNKIKPHQKEYVRYLETVGKRINILTQPVQDGFGHAVYCAKDWVGTEPFLLMLGDHIYRSTREISCARQLVEVYERVGKSAIGVTVTPAEELYHCGCVAGTWQPETGLINLSEVAEKPDLNYARSHLRVEGLAENDFLTVFGLYLLTPKIFEILEQNIRDGRRDRGEIQLTTALEQLRQLEGMYGCCLQGECFDTGVPLSYWQSVRDFRL